MACTCVWRVKRGGDIHRLLVNLVQADLSCVLNSCLQSLALVARKPMHRKPCLSCKGWCCWALWILCLCPSALFCTHLSSSAQELFLRSTQPRAALEMRKDLKHWWVGV
jgi:hypothetical protein